MHRSAAMAATMREVGIDGYVTKDGSMELLLAVVRQDSPAQAS